MEIKIGNDAASDLEALVKKIMADANGKPEPRTPEGHALPTDIDYAARYEPRPPLPSDPTVVGKGTLEDAPSDEDCDRLIENGGRIVIRGTPKHWADFSLALRGWKATRDEQRHAVRLWLLASEALGRGDTGAAHLYSDLCRNAVARTLRNGASSIVEAGR